uniref:Nardilysin n=1 Tax=Lygus hesperus TaxID=30085 RepID=A0A0K8TGT7_LYGHE
MLGGFCHRVRRTFGTITAAMFKRQKLDANNANMADKDARSPDRKKSLSKKVSDGGKLEYFATPNKADSDKKEYQVIRLTNGLVATIVSDTPNLIELGASDDEDSPQHSDHEHPSDKSESSVEFSDSEAEDGPEDKGTKEKLAACALTVEVGSFSDPVDIQGLSHFLEHMVFLGSEKYPKENEFDSYIRRFGGSDNAFTECEYTTYHFECPEKQLLKAMDIFSQFFIKPLLKWDAINREREAIESEFQEAFPRDSYRKDQLLCSWATKDNPARKFTWGNQYTLRDNVTDEHLYNTVKEYRETHYSADRMKLAVQGRLSLDVLRGWVVECFSKVPKFPNKADLFKPMAEPFDMEKFCRFYYVKSVKDLSEIEVRWVLPPVVRKYRTKSLKYLSFIIGHEGRGSLLSYLKKNVWALGLRAGYADDGLNCNDIYTIFTIAITLTDEGRDRIQDVLDATFSYLRMLREKAPDKRLFDEVKSLAEVGFRFQEEPSATDNVEDISQCMLMFPPEDYLRGDALYFEYDPDEIKNFLSKMTPSTVNIMYISKNHGVPCDQEEFWFKTKYSSQPIPEQWMTTWKNIEMNPEFDLPEKNEFITTDFTMVKHSKIPKYPSKITNTDLVEIWYKGDETFQLPIAAVDILIVTPKLLQSAETSVFTDMFLKLLQHQLIEELYHAVAADLEYTITSKEIGIHVGVYGYNQHLNLLVERIAEGFNHFNEKAEESMLEAFKKLFAQGYYNNTLKSGSLAKELRISAYMAPFYSSSEKYRQLKSVTMAKINEFADRFFEEVHFQALVQGNLSAEAGERIVQKFMNIVKPRQPLLQEKFPLRRVKILPKGEKCLRIQSFNRDDKNCVTTVYYQLGPGTIYEHTILELFVMIMEEPLFDKLRTQQQLGYDVSATVRETDGILGMSVSVHSQITKFTVDHVKDRIDEFVQGFVKSFPEMEDEDFQDQQSSLINLKSSVDTYLKQECRRNFEEIKSQEFVFDRLEKEIENISKLNKNAVSELITKLVSPDSSSEHKKLVVQVVGLNEQESNKIDDEPDANKHQLPDDIVYNFLSTATAPEGYFVTDLDEWNKSLLEYPPHKLVK